MLPLETNRRVLIWLCVFPPERYTSKWKKLAHVLFSLTILGINAGSFFGSLTFFLKYMHDDMEKSLFALVQMFGEVNMSYISIITFIQRHKILATYNSLTKIYRTHANHETMRFLELASRESEKMWMIFFNLIFKYGLSSMILSGVLTTMLGWRLEGQYVTKYSYHGFMASLPWDQSTLLGYAAEVIYDILLALAYVVAGSFMLYFISLCFHHRAFHKMFQHSLRKLDRPNNLDCKQFLCQLIRFHSSTRDFFEESAEAFSLYILVQLISAMLMLSGSVFQIDLQIRHPNFDASMILSTTVVSTLLLFLYCYYGKIATDSFQDIAGCLFESNWKGLPVDLQKYFILMIGNCHRPLVYHGFGVIILNLQTFTTLFKAVFTYYMVFKTITEGL